VRGAISNGRPYRDSNPFHPSRGLLAAILSLFPRRLQFPVPPGEPQTAVAFASQEQDGSPLDFSKAP
jgi:hypothetical protein